MLSGCDKLVPRMRSACRDSTQDELRRQQARTRALLHHSNLQVLAAGLHHLHQRLDGQLDSARAFRLLVALLQVLPYLCEGTSNNSASTQPSTLLGTKISLQPEAGLETSSWQQPAHFGSLAASK